VYIYLNAHSHLIYLDINLVCGNEVLGKFVHKNGKEERLWLIFISIGSFCVV